MTEDSTDYPRFAVNSAVASVTRQGLIILCPTFMCPRIFSEYSGTQKGDHPLLDSDSTAGQCHWAVIPCWAVSLRIHSAHTGKHCSSQ